MFELTRPQVVFRRFPDVGSNQHILEWKWRRVLKHMVSKFWFDERGATAIEYGLIAAGIALAIITVVNSLGTTMNDKFGSVSSSLK
ncbi:pilus assembly protein Flp/PilA [Bradyrhizobium sp. BR13661]|jgi:pilus assembly protein Flp/PilA|nr:pilus assembly protein Flp/PilA [Bradyrhizobium sp. BR13661]